MESQMGLNVSTVINMDCRECMPRRSRCCSCVEASDDEVVRPHQNSSTCFRPQDSDDESGPPITQEEKVNEVAQKKLKPTDSKCSIL